MKSRERLDSLRRAAEVAAGAMREVAHNLDEIAELLPRRETGRRLLLRQNSDRLQTAAASLTAEVNVGDPRTTRLVARVGAIGLLGVGALVPSIVGGAAEGVAATKVEALLKASQHALVCVEEVEARAQAAGGELPHDVHDDIDKIRQLLLGLGLEMEDSTEGDARKIVMDNGLAAPDLGLPNARQRLVYLRAALDGLRTQIPALSPPEAQHALEALELAEARIREARLDVELLARHDDSLYPPQDPSSE